MSKLLNRLTRGRVRVDYKEIKPEVPSKYPAKQCAPPNQAPIPTNQTGGGLAEAMDAGGIVAVAGGKKDTKWHKGLNKNQIKRLGPCMGQKGASLHLCQVMTA